MWTLSGFADEIDADLERQCEVLADLDIDYIEFRSAWGVNVCDLDDAQLDRVEAVLSEYDIAMSSVGSPIGKIRVDEDFDAHLQRFDRALRVAERFQAPYLRLFSFYPPKGGDVTEHRDEVLRRMSALAEHAKPYEVVLLHENEKEIYGDIPQRCVDIVTSVGAENLKLAWDAANYVQCGVRPFTEGYAATRPHTVYIQVKDARLADGSVVPAGEGDGQWPETIEALRNDGFDGFFSMEPHLALAGHSGGFSGADLFTKATRAFTGLLSERDIEFR
jgi:sugar phosphate isomerase/epimerase